MAIGIFLILILLFTFIVYLEVKKFFINRKLQKFELVRGAPFIGVVGQALKTSNYDVIDLILKFFDEAKSSTIRFWFGPTLVLGIYDPASVGIILTHEHSLNKPFFYEYLNCNTSIFSANKELWKPHRRALNPAFSTSVLLNHMPHLNEKSRILIKRMEPYLNEAGDLFRTISVCVMEMVYRTMFGVNMNLQTERGERLFETEKKFVNTIQYRFPRIWLRYDFIYHNLSKVGREQRRLLNYLNDMFEQIYNQKAEELKLQGNNEKSVNNFLEKCLQLEKQGILSRKNILEELLVVLVAGSDSSAVAVFGTLLMLAINPHHQELVVGELRSIFESADCDVTQSHLAAMNYMERVIKESMRLLPPALLIGRQTTADIDLPNGTVPKGTNVLISILHMNRNPQVWGENVLEFDPDRFLPENVEKRPPFSYLPFAGGSRICIGMKYSTMVVKIALAHLLRQYKFITDLKFDEIKVSMHLVLEIAIDKPLRIEKRNF